MKALVRNDTRKAIERRGFGHSVNRRTLKFGASVPVPFPISAPNPSVDHYDRRPQKQKTRILAISSPSPCETFNASEQKLTPTVARQFLTRNYRESVNRALVIVL